MHRILIVMLFVRIGSFIDAVENNPSNCQRLMTINHHYSSPYHLPDMDGDKRREGITFDFKVKAKSDGHLRLASSADAKKSPVTVEIIIGAGGNTFSAVRRKPKKSVLDYTVNTLGILSKEEFRSFTLILNGRNLTLSGNSSNVPFITYEDESLIDMKYISFGAWNNVAVEWSFDCRGAVVPEADITDHDFRLRKRLHSFRPPFPNNNRFMVQVAMRIVHVQLDPKTSQLTLRINLEEEWTHEKLRWDPQEYGNITKMNAANVVWAPTLQVFDVPWIERLHWSDCMGQQITVTYDGPVRRQFYSYVHTWCEVDVTEWPLDEHVCEIHLGLGPGQENVGLELTTAQIERGTEVSEWEILSITSSTVTEVNDAPPKSFRLKMKLKRVSVSYLFLFVIPLFIVFSMLITSFMMAPQHNKTRLTLTSASVVTLHLLLYVEQTLVPALPQSSPRIMNTTGALLIVAILHLIFHCFNVHVALLEIPLPRILKMLASKPWMKQLHQVTYKVFPAESRHEGLPDQVETNNENDPSNGRHRESDILTNKHNWALISRCLDVLTFTLSFLILPFILTPI